MFLIPGEAAPESQCYTRSMRVGILTISDSGSRGERVDTAGPAIAALMESHGNDVSATALVPDDRDQIEATLKLWADDDHLDVVLTTGGTGLSPRDVTPEATLAVADKVVPGFAEAMRAAGRQKTFLADMSRGVVVVRGRTLIVNLPGSERGARENLESILPLLPHADDQLHGDTATHHPD